ncbi:MAG: hypothetical protein ACR2IQ_01270 [Minisyncoccia bacterium]
MITAYILLVVWLHKRFTGITAAHDTVLDDTRRLWLTIAGVLIVFTIFAWQFPNIWIKWRFSMPFFIFLILIIPTIMLQGNGRTYGPVRRILIWLTIGVFVLGMVQSYTKRNQVVNNDESTEQSLETQKKKADIEVDKAVKKKIEYDVNKSFLVEAKEYQNKHEADYGEWNLNLTPNQKVRKFFPGFSSITVLTNEGEECFFTDEARKIFRCDGRSITTPSGGYVKDGYLYFTSLKPMNITLRIEKKNETEILDLKTN